MQRVSGYTLDEVIHESLKRVIVRGRRDVDDRPVILKMLPGDQVTPTELASLRCEHDVSRHLGNLAGVVPVLAFEDRSSRPAIVFDDVGGHSLDQQATLSTTVVLDLAVSLLKVLVGVHRKHVIHKDIKPANLLVDAAGSRIWIIDFGIASMLGQEEQPAMPLIALEGTLTFMAPEQTGRVNRPVDHRADLYAIGGTIYQLITGQPPFTATDPLELVHAHIARRAPSPHQVNPLVPVMLSAVVMRLLEKDVAARYQSAEGVLRDLQTCQRQLKESGSIPDFTLAQHEAQDRFQLPQGLYGREDEHAALVSAFQRAAAGQTTLACVHGHSGTGKTALIHELYQTVVAGQGTFIEGKFDQYRRDLPYSGLFGALQQLIASILGSSQAAIRQWSGRLDQALGKSSRLLTDVLPGLKLIISEQADVPELGEAAARDRFGRLLQAFVRACAVPEHPLVLFLDDMRWADQPSLDLLSRLLTEQAGGHLLVLASYRDQALTEGHPLAHTLAQVEAAQADASEPALTKVFVGPLSTVALTQLVSDTVHRPPAQTQPLAALIEDKTKGNPFFVHQLLGKLHRDILIHYVDDQGWTWSLDRLRQVAITDNVVELLVGRIEDLGERSRRLLQLAACIGGRFSLSLVAALADESTSVIAQQLWPALEQELIVPLDTGYRIAASEGGGEAWYRFQHDRVHQAAYSMVPEADRPALHLQAGLAQLATAQEHGKLEAELFSIADQLVTGSDLLIQHAQRSQAIDILRRAGTKAHHAAAYAPAAHYLLAARTLLGDTLWTDSYQRGQPVMVKLMACEWLSGQREEAEAHFSEIVQHSRDPAEETDAYLALIDLYTAQGRHKESLDRGVEALHLLGETIPRDPGMPRMLVELAQLKLSLIGKGPDHIAALPLCDDARVQRLDALIVKAIVSAYFTNINLYTLCVLRLCRRSLVHGLSPSSPYAWALYGIIIGPVLGDMAAGVAWSRAGEAAARRVPSPALGAKLALCLYGLVYPWDLHPDHCIPSLEAGVSSVIETGDPINAAWCSNAILYLRVQLGMAFDLLEPECARYLDFGRRNGVAEAPETFIVVQRMMAALRSETPSPTSFATLDVNGELIDEMAWVAQMQAFQLTIPIHLYWVCKLMTAWLTGAYDQGLQAAQELLAYKGATPGVGYLPLHPFFEGLCHASLAQPGTSGPHRKAVAAAHKALARLAATNPASFGHKAQLLEAELARLDQDHGTATSRYDAALTSATQDGFLREQGVAALQAARYHAALGRHRIALTYADEARACFVRLGATAVLSVVNVEFPDVRAGTKADPGSTHTVTSPTITAASSGSELDFGTLVRAAQALSGEIVLSRLIDRLLKLILQNAGARRAVLLLQRDDALVVVGERHIDREDLVSIESELADRSDLPHSVCHYVARVRDPVVIRDVARQRRFDSDPYLRSNPTRSLLCLPILHQGTTKGVVYLENELSPDVFTKERLELLNILCSQLVISIDNADLYLKVERQAQSFARFVPREFLAYLRKDSILDIEPGDAVEEEMTILFTDIRSFTAMAEQMSPRDNFRFINSYLRRMGPLIREHGGFIDKYVGDAIMALFPGPSDGALHAVLAMQERLKKLKWFARATIRRPSMRATACTLDAPCWASSARPSAWTAPSSPTP